MPYGCTGSIFTGIITTWGKLNYTDQASNSHTDKKLTILTRVLFAVANLLVNLPYGKRPVHTITGKAKAGVAHSDFG